MSKKHKSKNKKAPKVEVIEIRKADATTKSVATNYKTPKPPASVSVPSSDEERITRRFRKMQKKIKKLKAENNDPQIDLVRLQYMLDMTQRLIPISEQVYNQYKSERAAYALNALVDQSKSLMQDIRNLSNGVKQAEHINNKILLPNLQLLFQNYLSDCADLKSYLNELSNKDRKKVAGRLEAMMRNYSVVMNNIKAKTSVALQEYLVGS